jgi:hypothetical protein
LIASQSEEPLYENDAIIISTIMVASKATRPLANLNQIDTFVFIEIVQSHEALWNVRSVIYIGRKKNFVDVCEGQSSRKKRDCMRIALTQTGYAKLLLV